MKKRIAALIASLAVVLGLMSSQGSGAWFVTAVKRAQNINIAVINFDSEAELLGTLEEDYYGVPCIYPGQNLVLLNNKNATLTMNNNSSIDTHARVRIEYTSYATGAAKTVTYSGSQDDDLHVEFVNPEQWLPYNNGMDGTCFYYVGPNYGSSTLRNIDDVFTITPSVPSIDIIKSVYYDKDIKTEDYSGNEVTVNIIFEAKQADFVGWSTLGEYKVNSGVN